jgi:hypothetical protein
MAEKWFDKAARGLTEMSWQHTFWPAMEAAMTDEDSQMWLNDEIFIYKAFNLHLPWAPSSAREIFQNAIATDRSHPYCTKADFMQVVDRTAHQTLAEVLQLVMEAIWTEWMNGGQNYGQPTVIAAAKQGVSECPA